MTKRIVLYLALIAAIGGGGAAWGATDNTVVTVNASVAARASLVLGTTTISFPDANPGTVPSIAASQNAASVTASIRTGTASVATLQVLASGDLQSGSDTIPIGAVAWTATGSGFTAGTMNKTSSQTAGSWTGSGQRTGSFSYFLANSWDYAIGSYTATVTYTLTAP